MLINVTQSLTIIIHISIFSDYYFKVAHSHAHIYCKKNVIKLHSVQLNHARVIITGARYLGIEQRLLLDEALLESIATALKSAKTQRSQSAPPDTICLGDSVRPEIRVGS